MLCYTCGGGFSHFILYKLSPFLYKKLTFHFAKIAPFDLQFITYTVGGETKNVSRRVNYKIK